jgi:hypothetical protein
VNPGSAADFSYYHALRQYQEQGRDTWDAVVFSRAFADLASRCLAALASQSGHPAPAFELAELPALRAYMGAAQGADFAGAFASAIPPSWSSAQSELLGGLAAWLAQGFDAADPLSYTLQVWVGAEGQREVELYGPSRRPAPPAPFRQLADPPHREWLQANAHRGAAVIAHYDVHGLTMLALTERYLRRLGFNRVDSALSFEWTGDISKLWKRAVPKTLGSEHNYAAVVMVDCPVHSRTPDYTLKALQRVSAEHDQRLIIVDHHIDTFALAPRLMFPGVHLALTDILSCGLTETWDGTDLDLMITGALSDKVPEIYRAYPPTGEYAPLHAAVDEYNHRTLVFSPTPLAMKEAGEYPLRPLWSALIAGAPVRAEQAESALGSAPRPDELPLPNFAVLGSVAIVTDRLAAMGRAWYALLERIMDQEQVPYAIAVRLLNGQNANMLLLTRWQDPDKPPVRMFVPPEYLPRCLGHSTAVWADLPRDQALVFLAAVISRIAAYGGQSVDPEDALKLVKQNILQAQPVSNEERSAQHSPQAGKGEEER